MKLAPEKNEAKKENLKEKDKKKNKLIEIEEEHVRPKKKLKLYFDDSINLVILSIETILKNQKLKLKKLTKKKRKPNQL